jgi:putative FmdB family regulatory protein
MPTYEYACTKCGQHVEVFQRFSEAPLQTCGVCGGPLRKVFHAAGIVFKGSGFYATDSRSAPPSDGKDSGKDGGKDRGKDGGRDGGGDRTKADAPASTDGGGAKGGDGPKKGGSSGSTADRDSTASKEGSSGGTRPAGREKAS